MPIATEVAKVSGALRCGRERDCFRDAIPRPPETPYSPVFTGKTPPDFLEETAEYARRTRKRILAELKEVRRKKRLARG